MYVNALLFVCITSYFSRYAYIVTFLFSNLNYYQSGSIEEIILPATYSRRGDVLLLFSEKKNKYPDFEAFWFY